MAGQANSDLFQQAVDLFAQRIDEYASGIAQRLGQPMSGAQLTKDQVLERWNYTPLGDQTAADQQYHMLVAQGTPPGQALDQVYPFRKQLLAGPDLQSQIDTANKIAGWNADASGSQPPEPNPNQVPFLNDAQQQQITPPAVPPMPSGLPAAPPPGLPPGMSPMPQGPAPALPAPMPVTGV